MNTTMFIAETIKVGFQERYDTYSERLGYVVPMDNNGKFRKEKSFEKWCNPKLKPQQFQNTPTSGFVLNQRVGGENRGWKHRKTYVRVYDPRGFEVEISVDNLLYILEHTSSIVGKGLEGEFVYAWEGTELILLPTNAVDYKESLAYTEKERKQEYLTWRQLVVGGVYLSKDNVQLIYLGKHYEYTMDYVPYKVFKSSTKRFYFAVLNRYTGKNGEFKIEKFPSLNKKIIDVIDENQHIQYGDIMDYLENQSYYVPVDLSKTIVEPMSWDFFEKMIRTATREFTMRAFPRTLIAENGNKFWISSDENFVFHFSGNDDGVKEVDNRYKGKEYDVKTFKEVFDILKPVITHYYQENGRHCESVSHPFN